MAIRLNFIVEGQTEEAFVSTILKPHLEPFSIWASVRCVETSRKRSIKHRGGIRRYAVAKSDIQQWLLNDRNADARFTTMFDLYRLPTDFPGYADAFEGYDPYRRVAVLEDALAEDIADSRFVPYLQLHEFEALLLADPQMLDAQFPGYDGAIRHLISVVSQCGSPELVDGGENTAPSKRIIARIPEYEGRKSSAGPIVAGKIGLAAIRSRCDHFNEWLSALERLGI